MAVDRQRQMRVKPARPVVRSRQLMSHRPVGQLVGQRIAELRQERRLTLDALSAGTGLTPSFLSKLERGHTSISVDNLREIAHFLGVEMVHFFERPLQSRAVATRKGQGTTLGIEGTDVSGESLVATPRGTLQATLYRTPPGQGRETGFSHVGEEFVFIIRGRLHYHAGPSDFVLAAGDSVWHPSTEPHWWKNVDQRTTVSLHVNTPPVW